MHVNSFPKKIAIIIFLVFFVSFAFAGAQKSKDDFTELQKQARLYRDDGLAAQRNGDIETALSFYQKAVEIDPSFASAFNDLGILFEAKGQVERAEENYLRAISIDPLYLSCYTNLALLYEGKRDLEKASFFWQKRADLGPPDDPWTKNALDRVDDIALVLSKKPLRDLEEKEILHLTEKLSQPRTFFSRDEKSLAREHFRKAEGYFNQRNYAAAIKEALDAEQFDPANEEIDKFIEKVQLRALSE